MKTIRRIAGFSATCGVVFLSIVSARGGDSAGRAYFSTDGGIAWQRGMSIRGPDTGGGATRGKADFNAGSRIDFAFGCHITDSLAAEVETGFTYNSVKNARGTVFDGESIYF